VALCKRESAGEAREDEGVEVLLYSAERGQGKGVEAAVCTGGTINGGGSVGASVSGRGRVRGGARGTAH
jgi:hypothetical protein